MNTTDKILLGLSCHARSKCSECPYEDMPECSSKLAADAEKMYKQLAQTGNGAAWRTDSMRFIYGFIAILAWSYFVSNVCPGLPDEVVMLTIAIVAAGAMAGGA